jgi:hypothetical protein
MDTRGITPILIALLFAAGVAACADVKGGPERVGARVDTSSGDPAKVLLDLTRTQGGLPLGWELDENKGKLAVLAADAPLPTGASWLRIVGEDEDRALEFSCKDGSFSLNRDVSSLDLDDFPILEWTWRASKLPTGADLRESKKNDQVLQVLVQWGGIKKRVISYVWDTTAPVGTSATESYALGSYTVKVVCVQSGTDELGRWETVRRNLAEDYKELFGSKKYSPPRGVRIQTNSQYTESESAGAFRSVIFKTEPSEEEPGQEGH